MKKLSLILILFISLAFANKSYALGNGTGTLGATPGFILTLWDLKNVKFF